MTVHLLTTHGTLKLGPGRTTGDPCQRCNERVAIIAITDDLGLDRRVDLCGPCLEVAVAVTQPRVDPPPPAGQTTIDDHLDP